MNLSCKFITSIMSWKTVKSRFPIPVTNGATIGTIPNIYSTRHDCPKMKMQGKTAITTRSNV